MKAINVTKMAEIKVAFVGVAVVFDVLAAVALMQAPAESFLKLVLQAVHPALS
jgi:hypothetical protein